MNRQPVTLDLTRVNGNAFALVGAFRRQAQREGWTPEEISLVTEECMESDYAHLLATLAAHCEPPDDDEENA